MTLTLETYRTTRNLLCKAFDLAKREPTWNNHLSFARKCNTSLVHIGDKEQLLLAYRYFSVEMYGGNLSGLFDPALQELPPSKKLLEAAKLLAYVGVDAQALEKRRSIMLRP